MRTFQSYRGKNLAPFLRYKMYEYLAQKGRTVFYSTTELFNPASMKFKRKLGAKRKKLCVSICFFKKYPLNLILKKYHEE